MLPRSKAGAHTHWYYTVYTVYTHCINYYTAQVAEGISSPTCIWSKRWDKHINILGAGWIQKYSLYTRAPMQDCDVYVCRCCLSTAKMCTLQIISMICSNLQTNNGCIFIIIQSAFRMLAI